MQNKNINDFDITIISDPHVLDRELMGNNEAFKKELNIERKLIIESEALLKKSLELAENANSEILILPGDLVKEGEYKSHKLVAKLLKQWKQKDDNRKIFLIPGNHDINNHKAYDYKNEKIARNINPSEFYDLYDFLYKDESIVEFYKDTDIFKTYLDKINKEYDRSDEYSYYAHGYFSYYARVIKNKNFANGLSIIMLDTSIYSADSEEKQRDGRENIAGSVTDEQMKWVVEKIEQAKKNKDLIFVIAHHAFLPNFRNQELVLAPFIIKQWRDKFSGLDDPRIDGKTPIEVLADNGVKFLFTGHLHENGTAKFISELGNEIYDVQTGSPITYPLPIRHILVENKTHTDHGFDVFIKTELIKDFSFKDLFDKEIEVSDAQIYTLEDQLSLRDVFHNYIRIQANNPNFSANNLKKRMIDAINENTRLSIPYTNYMNEVVFPMIEDIFPIKRKYLGRILISNFNYNYEFRIKSLGSSVTVKAMDIEDCIDIILKQLEKILTPHFIVESLDMISSKIFSMPIDTDNTLYDFLNYIYQYRSTNPSEKPDYVENMINNLNNPDYDPIDIVLEYAKDEINKVYDKITKSVLLEKNGSKREFFNNLIKTRGLPSSLAFKYLYNKVDTLSDLINFFSRFILKKDTLTGTDLAKLILYSRSIRRAKINISDKMLGQKSLRKFILGLIGEMNIEMSSIYQNADVNELDHYFNYIEYIDKEN